MADSIQGKNGQLEWYLWWQYKNPQAVNSCLSLYYTYGHCVTILKTSDKWQNLHSRATMPHTNTHTLFKFVELHCNYLHYIVSMANEYVYGEPVE